MGGGQNGHFLMGSGVLWTTLANFFGKKLKNDPPGDVVKKNEFFKNVDFLIPYLFSDFLIEVFGPFYYARGPPNLVRGFYRFTFITLRFFGYFFFGFPLLRQKWPKICFNTIINSS